MKFSDWLIKRYKIKVMDFEQSKMPWLWRKFDNVGAMAVKGKYVYVKRLSGKTESQLCRTLVHELRHIKRQRKLGWGIYLLRYALSPKFRGDEEINAYTHTMEIKHIGGKFVSPYHYARIIRDNYYVGNKQYKRAKAKLKDRHDRILSGHIHDVKDLLEEWSATQ